MRGGGFNELADVYDRSSNEYESNATNDRKGSGFENEKDFHSHDRFRYWCHRLWYEKTKNEYLNKHNKGSCMLQLSLLYVALKTCEKLT